MRAATRAATLLTTSLIAWPMVLAGGTATPAAAAQPDGTLRIELDSMSPRLVTADGPGVLTVTGRVSNSGARMVTGMDVRVQRGEPAGTEDELRAALSGVTATDTARPRFTDVPGDLPPGGSVAFRVDVALRGGGELDSLGIDAPGVYPLLVNLNGTPDDGDRARLAATRLLLPVLGLPAGVGVAPRPPVPPAARTPLTIVWPLIDRPRRLPNSSGELPVLTDDDLAVSLAPGGRLRGLLDAVAEFAPPGSPLAPALCFAIDPELIDTVAVMAQGGYQVAGGRPGSGGRDAAEWLQLLTAMLKGRCTMALPFADVDQVALSRAGLTDLQGRARTDGEQILIDTLGVQPISDLVWPAGELIDERTLTDLASLGDTAVLLDPAGLADPGAAIDRPTVGLRTGSPATAGLRGVPVDALVGSVLDGSALDDSAAGQPAPGSVSASTAVPAGTARPLSTHEGAAALAWRVMAGSTTAGVLVTPPRRWAASGVETGELLRTAGELVAAGFAQPRDLERIATPEVPAVTTTVQYPMRAGAEEVVRSITTDVTAVRNQLRDMDAATDRDPRANVDPASLLDPLRYNLLRATSSAWRADQGGDGAAGQRFAADASWRLTALRQGVQIEPPAGPYLMAASDAPLLLTLNNPLPVQIDVQISLSEVQGLRTGSIDVVQVPAASRRQVRIPTEVIRAGQFSVEAQLSTPGGTPLGPPAASRIQLRSTAYGTVTLALTGGGAILLVLLAGLRITRRVRAARKVAS